MKLGTDWLYIGLGIGAIYLVYKLTKPVSDVAGDVAGITNAVGDTAEKVIYGLSDTVGNVFTPVETGSYPSVSEWLFKSPLVTVPAAIETYTSSSSSKNKTVAEVAKSLGVVKSSSVNKIDYSSPAVLASRDRSKDSFSSQSSGDVAASLKPGVKAYVSPFTGKAFTR